MYVVASTLAMCVYVYIADIAVDWIQDILYWIIAGESKIYRLNITSADPTQEEVEVNGVNGRTIFADMVLNPISRYAGSCLAVQCVCACVKQT